MMSTGPLEHEPDREEILSVLAEAIQDVHARISEYEVDDESDERLLIKWYRTLGNLSGQYRKLKKDTDVDEMEEELELIKAATQLGDDR